MKSYDLEARNQLNADYLERVMDASERDAGTLDFIENIKKRDEPFISLATKYYRILKHLVIGPINRTLDSTVHLPIMPEL